MSKRASQNLESFKSLSSSSALHKEGSNDMTSVATFQCYLHSKDIKPKWYSVNRDNWHLAGQQTRWQHEKFNKSTPQATQIVAVNFVQNILRQKGVRGRVSSDRRAWGYPQEAAPCRLPPTCSCSAPPSGPGGEVDNTSHQHQAKRNPS